MKAMRKGRAWLQDKLASVMGKPQSTISRWESEDYGKWTLESLFEVADAFDVAVVVEFVSYADFMIRTSDLSPERMAVSSYTEKGMAFLTAPTNGSHQILTNDKGFSSRPIFELPTANAGPIIPTGQAEENWAFLVRPTSENIARTVQ
jgi:transcriptional regulator with XRE-family HTH domain